MSDKAEAETPIRFFGVGREARIAALLTADDLRACGAAAAALFKPRLGGWIVQVIPGGIRRRTGEDGSGGGRGPGE